MLYFQHPEYTNNEIIQLGEDPTGADITLRKIYKLERAEIFNLTYEGHIWQKDQPS